MIFIIFYSQERTHPTIPIFVMIHTITTQCIFQCIPTKIVGEMPPSVIMFPNFVVFGNWWSTKTHEFGQSWSSKSPLLINKKSFSPSVLTCKPTSMWKPTNKGRSFSEQVPPWVFKHFTTFTQGTRYKPLRHPLGLPTITASWASVSVLNPIAPVPTQSLRPRDLNRILGCYRAAVLSAEFGQVCCFFSPPARWGLLDFIRAVLLLLLRLLTRRLLLAVQIPVGTARPPPRAPDPSGHCRTSTASCRSQRALPDLNRDFQVAVGTAGPQPQLPDRSGHCRTSTATSRSQWALPDLNGKNVRKDVR